MSSNQRKKIQLNEMRNHGNVTPFVLSRPYPPHNLTKEHKANLTKWQRTSGLVEREVVGKSPI